ncbi:IS3 family transposase [Streptomyces sp. NPDC047737]|uniref:IS3 family transposase n=1 Tax=Streptomyces sp. NPDC047737 TaxID=3155740 RepID=UPI0033DFEB5E
MSQSWNYKWRDRPPTGREQQRQQLAGEIEEIFTESGGTYGSPKIFVLLVRRGWRIPVNTVAKLMAELGLVAQVNQTVQEPDRLQDRVLGRPHRGAGCIGRTPQFAGIDDSQGLRHSHALASQGHFRA